MVQVKDRHGKMMNMYGSWLKNDNVIKHYFDETVYTMNNNMGSYIMTGGTRVGGTVFVDVNVTPTQTTGPFIATLAEATRPPTANPIQVTGPPSTTPSQEIGLTATRAWVDLSLTQAIGPTTNLIQANGSIGPPAAFAFCASMEARESAKSVMVGDNRQTVQETPSKEGEKTNGFDSLMQSLAQGDLIMAEAYDMGNKVSEIDFNYSDAFLPLSTCDNGENGKAFVSCGTTEPKKVTNKEYFESQFSGKFIPCSGEGSGSKKKETIYWW